jgi:DNA-binding NtrC family response regulator
MLIEGERVGKEIVARAILPQPAAQQPLRSQLRGSRRAPQSTLWSRARRSTTITEQTNLVEDADGGTLFLDEVADLTTRTTSCARAPATGGASVRVVQRKVDVRIVSAINHDMRAEARPGASATTLIAWTSSAFRCHS